MGCRYLPRAGAQPHCTPPGRAAAGAGVTVGVLRPTQRQLVLAVLALGASPAVPPGELVDARWEQVPASAVNTVHKHVRAPRAVLEPGRGGQLLTGDYSYAEDLVQASLSKRHVLGVLPAISETATSSSNTQ